jgi:hypothetical protein
LNDSRKEVEVRSVKSLTRLLAASGAAMLILVGTASAASAGGAASGGVNITGVSFSGPGGVKTPPTVTVSGSGFGSRAPKGTPDTTTPLCGTIANNGDTYGSRLYFVDNTQNWQAGFLSKTNHNCIGLVVQSWSDTQIVLTFGSYYGPTQLVLNNGDNFAMVVKGGTFGGLVSGLS